MSIVYNQLKLHSNKFSGQVLGPVCLYFDAQPDQEEYAVMCLDSIPEVFLMKITRTEQFDVGVIKGIKEIKAEIYTVHDVSALLLRHSKRAMTNRTVIYHSK